MYLNLMQISAAAHDTSHRTPGITDINLLHTYFGKKRRRENKGEKYIEVFARKQKMASSFMRRLAPAPTAPAHPGQSGAELR